MYVGWLVKALIFCQHSKMDEYLKLSWLIRLFSWLTVIFTVDYTNKGSNYRNGKKEVGASGIRNSVFQNQSTSSYSTGVIQIIYLSYFAYKTIRNNMFTLPSMGMCVFV
jgi:hypothetical protein